jgi:hypothetical protein
MERQTKPFGSGHFGEWITDPNGLPAYHYTCNQNTDPAASSLTNPVWRGATDHTFQFGNDRIIVVAANSGIVQVRQDEHAPKILQDIYPAGYCYGGGIGWLTDGKSSLCTHYSCPHDSFDRVYGVGYLCKKVTKGNLHAEQVIFVPFGDDPVLISRVTISNPTGDLKNYRWFEYWGTRPYPLSFRALMLTLGGKGANLESLINNPAKDFRRKFAEKYKHCFVQHGNVLDLRLVFGGWNIGTVKQ